MEQLLDATVSILRSSGLNAGLADTGGGNLCVVVATAGEALDVPRFVFGTAGECWAAEVAGDDRGLWTAVGAEEKDPEEIASGILAAIADWSRSQRSLESGASS